MKQAPRDWTDAEDRLLRKCWAEDGSTADLAKQVNRSITACQARAQFLGLTKVHNRHTRRSDEQAKREADYFNMRSLGYTTAQARDAMMLSHKMSEKLSAAWSYMTVENAQKAATEPNNDDRHVKDCLDAGGFVYREQRGTTICDIYPDGRVVVLWQVGRAA